MFFTGWIVKKSGFSPDLDFWSFCNFHCQCKVLPLLDIMSLPVTWIQARCAGISHGRLWLAEPIVVAELTQLLSQKLSHISPVSVHKLCLWLTRCCCLCLWVWGRGTGCWHLWTFYPLSCSTLNLGIPLHQGCSWEPNTLNFPHPCPWLGMGPDNNNTILPWEWDMRCRSLLQ